jgi:outer membrane protein
MILDVSNPNTPVLYASSGIDITQDIVSLYDKTSSGGGPAPTGATTPAPGTPAPRTNAVPAPRTTTPAPAGGTRAPGTVR